MTNPKAKARKYLVFRDPPGFNKVEKDKKSQSVVYRRLMKLKKRQGEWAIWPTKAKGAYSQINRAKVKYQIEGNFEVMIRKGEAYVRYLPPTTN